MTFKHPARSHSAADQAKPATQSRSRQASAAKTTQVTKVEKAAFFEDFRRISRFSKPQ